MRVRDYFHAIISRFAIWGRNTPIDTNLGLQRFVADKAAYVAQTTLYGYIRTRAGLQHFQLFNDDTFNAALRPARNRVFIACASDLSVFAVARLMLEDQSGSVQPAEVATALFLNALGKLAADPLPDAEMRALCDREQARFQMIDWLNMATGDAAFQASIRSVITEAPIIDALKVLDEEIVINSVRFKWQEVRGELVHRLNASAIIGHLNHPQ
jgi:hypothetical protein